MRASTRPSRMRAAQLRASSARVAAPVSAPSASTAANRRAGGLRTPTAQRSATTQAGIQNRKRPVASPAPNTSGTSTPGPGLIRGHPSSLRRTPAAPGGSADPPQRIHHGHVDRRATLVLVQVEIGNDRPLQRADVTRRNPVQRVDVGIRPADIAAAEIGEVASQLIVRRKDVLFDEVSDHTTASWL